MTKVNLSIKTLYVAKGDSDCEGRGPKTIIGYFNSEILAKEAAQGQGAMGSPGYVSSVEAICLEFDDGTCQYFLNKPIEVMSITPQQLKERALRKLQSSLSQEELEILGIKV
jgi:hypothetical protein